MDIETEWYIIFGLWFLVVLWWAYLYFRGYELNKKAQAFNIFRGVIGGGGLVLFIGVIFLFIFRMWKEYVDTRAK